MLIIAVTFVLLEEHRASFLEAVLENARISQEEEPGCVRFDVCEGANGLEVFLYEQYETDRDFDEVHLKSKHFLDFNEQTAPWVAEKKVSRYLLVPFC